MVAKRLRIAVDQPVIQPLVVCVVEAELLEAVTDSPSRPPR